MTNTFCFDLTWPIQILVSFSFFTLHFCNLSYSFLCLNKQYLVERNDCFIKSAYSTLFYLLFFLSAIAYSDYKRTYDDMYDENNVYKHISLLDYLNTTTPDYNDVDDEECCSCSKDSHSVRYDDDEAEFQIHFEDFLQNTVYIKK